MLPKENVTVNGNILVLAAMSVNISPETLSLFKEMFWYLAEFFPEIQVMVSKIIMGTFTIMIVKLEYDEYSQTGSLCLHGLMYAVKASFFTIAGYISVLIFHSVAHVNCLIAFVSIAYLLYETSEKILTTCQQHDGKVEIILQLNRMKLEKLKEKF